MNGNLQDLTVASLAQAQIISTSLESAGIECYLRNAGYSSTEARLDFKILVKEENFERALALLSNLHLESQETEILTVEEAAYPDLFLIPVDFSNASLNACFYALELAARFKARIKLINTFGVPDMRPLSFDDADFYTSITTQITEIRQEAEKNLVKFVLKLKAYLKEKNIGDVPITASLINGIPDEITLYTAESDNAGMIILGVSGKNVRTFEPIGRTASRLAERSKVPVLIIPEEAVFTGIQSVRNILYATAFDESDFSAIRKLISFSKKINNKVYCLHISTEEAAPWDKVKMDGLQGYFKKVYENSDVECDYMISKDLLKALDEFITSKSIHIIAVNSHKRNLISKLISPSVTLKILYHTRIPLLVFHG
jgi:nucleotide-binding universal stress UspA family protein